MKRMSYTLLKKQLEDIGLDRDVALTVFANLPLEAPMYEISCPGDYKGHRTQIILQFLKLDQSNYHSLHQYTLRLYRTPRHRHTIIGDIDTAALEHRMRAINWHSPIGNDEASARQAVAVWLDMQQLASTIGGRLAKEYLELKYWSNTPFVTSEHQALYDLLQMPVAGEITVGVKNGKALAIDQACRYLLGEINLNRAKYGPEQTYLMRCEKMDLSLILQHNRHPELTKEDHYFTTLKKAFEHMTQYPDAAFSPQGVRQEGLDHWIQSIQLVDGSDGATLARRKGLWPPFYRRWIDDAACTGLTLNYHRISRGEFCQETGCELELEINTQLDANISVLPKQSLPPVLEKNGHPVNMQHTQYKQVAAASNGSHRYPPAVTFSTKH
ncbi:hypothetical protein [Chitinophaga tropicalis]|uniref:Uncharacterized protein n=1 Tax=Chitinophaga tropicalis TaxID=2683588 RepID=A0A7K1TZZ2_9BACT|nr:hypothetical protein [Chitinophaga tropicalis]MVT07684.1 hypothetical protein [Chitinophaga tropicalis]